MKIIREPGMQSGFVVQHPLASVPELTHINEAVCDANYRLPAHTHGGHEFHYLLQGSLEWEFHQTHHRQEAGELFIIRPQTPHLLATRPRRETPFHIFSMGIRIGDWQPPRERLLHLLPSLEHRPLKSHYDFEPLMRSVFRYCLRKDQAVTPVVRAHLEVFFLQLEEQATHASRNAPATGLASYPVEKALRYMEETLHRKMSLEEIAGVAHLAPSHFANRFRDEIGLPPMTHHRNLRLSAARKALEEPGSDITEIAYRYGFGSVQHFHARFRQKYGLPPGRWKAAVR